MQRGEEVLNLLSSGKSYKEAALHLGIGPVSARSAMMRFIKRAGEEFWKEGCFESDSSETPNQNWIVKNAERIREANIERDLFSELPLEMRKAIDLLSRHGYKVEDQKGRRIEPF